MTENFENLIQYNDDNTVNVSFGHIAEWYILNNLLLKDICLKCQSQRRTSELIKENLISVNRVGGAIDFIE